MNASFGNWGQGKTYSFNVYEADKTEEEERLAYLMANPVLAPGFEKVSWESVRPPSMSVLDLERGALFEDVLFDNTSSRSGMSPMSEETRQEQQEEQRRYIDEKVQEALDNLPSDATPMEQEQAKQGAILAAVSSLLSPGPKNYLMWGLGGLLLLGVGFLIFRKKD